MRTKQQGDDDNVLRDGRLIVPMRLMDSTRPRVGETYNDFVRRVTAVDCDMYDTYDQRVSQQYKNPAVSDEGEYVRRRPKKKQYRDPEGRETGTSEEVEDSVGQAGFVARDAATHARLDDCYETYDSEISAAWNKPTHTATRDDAKACRDCGTANRADASFCDNCGAEFADDGVDAIVSATQTPNDGAAEPLANLTGIGSRGPRGQQEGAACTINGRAGHLRSVNGTLQCVPDARTAKPAPSARREYYDPAVGAIRPHGDASATKDAAYSSYDSDLRDAWRQAR
jgi:hypothetical protein